MRVLSLAAALAVATTAVLPVAADAAGKSSRADASHRPHAAARKQVGKASIYAHRFAGRRMANGRPMSLHDDNAASRTLPLGTRALVTNLDTGRSAVVTIEDRGPYVDGRIVDLSPASASQIGLSAKQGLATVEVTPLSVPEPGQGTGVAEDRPR